MAGNTHEDPLTYSLRRRKGRSVQSVPASERHAKGGSRKPGTKQSMLYMPPDLHTAVQMRKAVTGADMGDIMLQILREGLAEELEMVRKLAK
ncbi:MAG: hypothetical protein Q4A07_08725 [Coriobacteriales bacterium]|nr:hypothetical protein [Coriobacteriales bacterium]